MRSSKGGQAGLVLGRAGTAAATAALFFVAGCLPYPHPKDGVTVEGSVYDNDSNSPIPGADVEIELPGSFGEYETKTDRQGRFTISSDGEWSYTVSLLPDDGAPRVVRAKFSHPKYKKLSVHEYLPEGSSTLNLGSIYLDPDL